MDSSLLELRILDGPNLYFPHAAVKLTLDLTSLVDAGEGDAVRLARTIGLSNARPGPPGTGFRQRFVARAVARLVRQIAAEAETHRLAVRVRATSDVHRLVVAYPWRHRSRADALGRAVAELLDALPDGEVEQLVKRVAARVREADLGSAPRTLQPRIPVVAVTGTNGKTTTARLVAHVGRCAGRHVGWSSTDGIYIDGVVVETGDFAGPSGAGRVLAHPEVELAVTETARGGILLRGIGVTHNDVSVVTNVTADHLGLHEVETVDHLAEVQAVVTRITRSDGWCVLNGDDPRVLSMRSLSPARPWVFSRHPDSPAIREVLEGGGRATSVIDGWICVLAAGHDPDPLAEVVGVPLTLCGMSRCSLENALAGASAALAAGLPREAVVTGLGSFLPDTEHNPGRLNLYSLGEVTVVVDLAHNMAGLEALLEAMQGVRRPGGRLLLGLGTAGDRAEEIVVALGELAARTADVPALVHLGGLEALVAQAEPGDVVAVMCHQDGATVDRWLRGRGAKVDDPGTVCRKVYSARQP